MQWRGDALRLHPPRKARLRVPDAGGDDVEFGQPRLVRGPVAEIGIDRGDESAFVVRDDGLEPRETVTPRREFGIAFARKRRTLQFEQPQEFDVRRAGIRFVP